MAAVILHRVVGAFMEMIAALIILFPPPLAVAPKVGVDAVRFAIIVVIDLLICDVIVLALLSYIPELALWLPSVFYK